MLEIKTKNKERMKRSRERKARQMMRNDEI